ncbi:hypothetical protein HMPREF0880_02453 [Yokenella regensburgei ATCC 43003]|nr:hypothetical protein HMPREF0880_02453 [Yokenella regensburgei ATCC 43003]
MWANHFFQYDSMAIKTPGAWPDAAITRCPGMNDNEHIRCVV